MGYGENIMVLATCGMVGGRNAGVSMMYVHVCCPFICSAQTGSEGADGAAAKMKKKKARVDAGLACRAAFLNLHDSQLYPIPPTTCEGNSAPEVDKEE